MSRRAILLSNEILFKEMDWVQSGKDDEYFGKKDMMELRT